MLTNEELELLGQIPAEEYQRRVLALFKYGFPTETQWRQMAYAVLYMSENLEADAIEDIQRAVIALGLEGRPMPEPLPITTHVHTEV